MLSTPNREPNHQLAVKPTDVVKDKNKKTRPFALLRQRGRDITCKGKFRIIAEPGLTHAHTTGRGGFENPPVFHAKSLEERRKGKCGR